MTSLRKGLFVQSVWVVWALVMFLTTPAFAGGEPSSELRQLIIDAEMVPWSGRAVPLDETLRQAPKGEKVQLRQFVTGEKPLLVYMYGYW